MKNIQEILLKCEGKGKLKLGDEEIDVSIVGINSEIHQLDDWRNSNGIPHEGERYIGTHLEVCVFGDEFSNL